MRHIVLSGLVALAAAGTLAACSGSGSGSAATSVGLASSPTASAAVTPQVAAGAGSTAGSTATSGSSSSGDVLATASTSLGTVVVDGKGMTAYVFDKDPVGTTTSTCTGGCATIWPPIDSASATPSVQGVTGTVGTITGSDGKLQVTLDGRPLYTFAQDTAMGDTKGQGVMNIWWVVGPDGTVMH